MPGTFLTTVDIIRILNLPAGFRDGYYYDVHFIAEGNCGTEKLANFPGAHTC